ncbi:hypothetical protein D3C79_710930 [compost metagenome]
MRTRVVAIVHAQQADHLERDRTHGHQGAEIYRTCKKTLGQAPLVEPGQPGFANHGERQQVLQANRFTGLQPGFAQGLQLHQQIVVMLGFGQEKHLQQGMQALAPLGSSCRLGKLLVSDFQGVEQGHQRADQGGIQAADFIERLDTIAAFADTDGVTQQHAPQAKSPAVLFEIRRQAEARALLGVQAPANAGAFDPAVQGRKVAFLDGEARTQGWHIEQVKDLAHREAAIR